MTDRVLAEIKALIEGGDWNRCYDWWLQTTAEQRLALRSFVKQQLPRVREDHRKLEKGSESIVLREGNPELMAYRKDLEKIASFYIGVFATGTRAEVESLDLQDWLYYWEKIATLLNHVRPAWLPEYVDSLFSWKWIGGGHHTDFSIGYRQLELGQKLVDLQAVPDPACSGQALGMVFQTHRMVGPRRGFETVYDFIQSRPHVLDRLIWHLFEVAGAGTTNMYMCDFLLERGTDRTPDKHRTWRRALVLYCREGKIPRDRLLDAVLRGISFDFSGHLPTWYMGLFEALEPTDDEIEQRASVFLNLVTSDSQRLVSFALKYVDRLDLFKIWKQDQWLQITSNLLASKLKVHADAGLKYAIKIAKAHPHLRAPLFQQSMPALSHPAAGFQAKLLKFFACYPEELTADLVAEAQTWRDMLPPTLRDKFDQLFRVTVEPKVFEFVSRDEPIRGSGTRLAPDRVIAPIASAQELIERILYLLENHRDLVETEQVVEGMIRYNGPLKPSARDLQPIAKRAVSRVNADDPLREELYSTVLAWANGSNRENHFLLFYRLRMAEIRRHILKENRLPLLSTPTHRGFWLDPAALVERALQWQSGELEPGAFDLVFALLRLPGEANGPALEMAAKLNGVVGQVIRYALGGDPQLTQERPELWAAVARARCPGHDAPEVAQMFPDVDPGAGTYPTISLHYERRKVNYYQSEKTFDYDEAGAEISPRALLLKVDPIYVSVNCFHRYLFGFPIALEKPFANPEVGHCQFLGSPPSLYWLAAAWPSDRESVYAQCCYRLIYHQLKLAPDGTSFLPEFVKRFFDPEEKLGFHCALLLGLLWVAPVADFRLLASQLLCDVLRAGRWDLDLLSRMLLKIHELRCLSIVRLVKAIQSMVEADPQSKSPVLKVIEMVVVKLPDLASDSSAGRLFELWLELLTETKQQVTAPDTQAFLQQLQQGKSKVGTVAKRIVLLRRSPMV